MYSPPPHFPDSWKKNMVSLFKYLINFFFLQQFWYWNICCVFSKDSVTKISIMMFSMSKHTRRFLSHEIITIKQHSLRHKFNLSWDTFCSPYFCWHLRFTNINCATHSDTKTLIWKWIICEHFILNLMKVYQITTTKTVAAPEARGIFFVHCLILHRHRNEFTVI